MADGRARGVPVGAQQWLGCLDLGAQYQPSYEMNKAMTQLAEETSRDVGAYVLYTLVLGETEAEARAKSKAGGIIGQD